MEFVLHALAAELTTSLVYHAAARGIRIESVESKLEGDLDLRGYRQVRVHFTIKSNASAKQLEEFAKLSHVYDLVSNPVLVSIAITTV